MDDLFSNSNTGSADTQIDPKSAYEQLVGEGKKYASNELLAASRVHADKFIEKLQSENAELRNELNSRLTVEQMMTKLSDRQGINDGSGNRDNMSQPPQNLEVNPPSVQLTEEAIAKLVQKELATQSSRTTAQANTAVVVSELKKQFGDGYVDHMQARLNELGISKEAAVQMAATMPKAYLELVGKRPTQNASTTNQAPPKGINTAFQSQASDPNNPGMSYFNKLRKENPREYFKPHIQNQIMALASRYGDEFLNR